MQPPKQWDLQWHSFVACSGSGETEERTGQVEYSYAEGRTLFRSKNGGQLPGRQFWGHTAAADEQLAEGANSSTPAADRADGPAKRARVTGAGKKRKRK